jgi:hypothetical protein
MKTDGSVAVTGMFRALTCSVGSLDQEELVVLLDGHEIRRLQPNNGEYLLGAPKFEARDLLAALGIPAELATQHRLTFRREGTGCGGEYPEPSHDVVTLILDFAPTVEDEDMFGWFYGQITTTGDCQNTTWDAATLVDELLMSWYWYEDGVVGDFTGSIDYDTWTPPTFSSTWDGEDIGQDSSGAVTLHDDGSATLDWTVGTWQIISYPFDPPAYWTCTYTFTGTRQP